MFYVLLNPNGSIKQYPYTLTDLRLDNRGTSFAKELSDEVAATFNCFPVVPAPEPADDHTLNHTRIAVKQGDQWVEQWVSSPATPEDIAERTNVKAEQVRAERALLLEQCDWTQLGDSPVQPVNEWRVYRQALRDITQQPGYPHNISWPDPPNTDER